jgi:hypothetical protein
MRDTNRGRHELSLDAPFDHSPDAPEKSFGQNSHADPDRNIPFQCANRTIRVNTRPSPPYCVAPFDGKNAGSRRQRTDVDGVGG